MKREIEQERQAKEAAERNKLQMERDLFSEQQKLIKQREAEMRKQFEE